GIRDRNVTGVQTCALPILRPWSNCSAWPDLDALGLVVEFPGQAEQFDQGLTGGCQGVEIGPSPAEADHIAAYGMPIDDLDLSVQIGRASCRERAGQRGGGG